MTKTFLISDHHFGHDSIYKFTNNDGERIRPWADNSRDGDRLMIEAWNNVVTDQDKVYHLGDLLWKRSMLPLLKELKGRKVLIMGNHDKLRAEEYLKYFEDVRGAAQLGTCYLTHIPIHPNSLPRWCTMNIHGHLHSNHVTLPNGTKDTRYFNVSVEQCLDLQPMDFEDILKKHAEGHSTIQGVPIDAKEIKMVLKKGKCLGDGVLNPKQLPFKEYVVKTTTHQHYIIYEDGTGELI